MLAWEVFCCMTTLETVFHSDSTKHEYILLLSNYLIISLRSRKSVVLAQHLVGDHLGLDDVGHGPPQLGGLQSLLLLPPEAEQPLLDLCQDQQVLASQLGAAVVNVSDEVQHNLHFTGNILQQVFIRGIFKSLGKFHVELDLDVEVVMDLIISVNFITKSPYFLLIERGRVKSLFYFCKSFEFFTEVLGLFTLRAGEVEGVQLDVVISAAGEALQEGHEGLQVGVVTAAGTVAVKLPLGPDLVLGLPGGTEVVGVPHPHLLSCPDPDLGPRQHRQYSSELT